MPYYDLATRAQAVILRAMGKKLDLVSQITEITTRQIMNLVKKAMQRGWSVDSPLMDRHLDDAPKSGRRKKMNEPLEQRIIDAVRTDRYGREKSCATLGRELGCSSSAVHRVLKKYGYNKTKTDAQARSHERDEGRSIPVCARSPTLDA